MHLKPLTEAAMQLYDYATVYADISLWGILLLIHNIAVILCMLYHASGTIFWYTSGTT